MRWVLLEDICHKIKQTTDQYINTILPPLTKALFKDVVINILSVLLVTWAVLYSRKARR